MFLQYFEENFPSRLVMKIDSYKKNTANTLYIYKYVSLNNKDKFCLYNLFKILPSFLISVLVSGWNS